MEAPKLWELPEETRVTILHGVVLALLAINFDCAVHTEARGNWHLVLTHDSFSSLIETARPSGGEGKEANRFLK